MAPTCDKIALVRTRPLGRCERALDYAAVAEHIRCRTPSNQLHLQGRLMCAAWCFGSMTSIGNTVAANARTADLVGVLWVEGQQRRCVRSVAGLCEQ